MTSLIIALLILATVSMIRILCSRRCRRARHIAQLRRRRNDLRMAASCAMKKK
jgi:hypothetical protein